MDRDAFTESSVERLKLRDENKRLVCRALQRLQRVCMNSMVVLLLFRCCCFVVVVAVVVVV